MSLLSRALERLAAAHEALTEARARLNESAVVLEKYPAPVIAAPVVDPWVQPTPKFLLDRLNATSCLCGEVKNIGWYKCSACRAVKS